MTTSTTYPCGFNPCSIGLPSLTSINQLVMAHAKGIQTNYIPEGMSVQNFLTNVQSPSTFQRSGITDSNPLYTPIPIRYAGETGSDQFHQVIPANTAYYIDPWNVVHFGTPSSNGTYTFKNPGAEQSGTAELYVGFSPTANKTLQDVGNGQFSVSANNLGTLANNFVNVGRCNSKFAKKDSGLGILGTVLDIASVIPSPIQPFAEAANAAINIGEGISNHNLGQIVSGALSIPGVGGAVSNYVGSALSNVGVPAAAVPYATQGVISAAKTGLSGGSLDASLLSGIGAAAGSYASNSTKSALTDTLGKTGAGAVAAGTGAATKALITGQPLNTSLISGLASGAGNYVGNTISGFADPNNSSLVNNLIKGTGNLASNLTSGAISKAAMPTSGLSYAPRTLATTTDAVPATDTTGATPTTTTPTTLTTPATTAQGGLSNLGLPAIPWLTSGPTMIGGGTSGHRSDKNPLYESAGNSLMEVKKGGLIGHYPAGGIVGITCLNQCPCYMPTYVKTGVPTMLESRKHDTSNTGLRMLHQLYPVISERGNMNELSKGGLPRKYAEAAPKGHKPEFITGLTGYYACGGGTGQSDDIPAMLHDGDYVMDAETVSALGDGSSKAGREVLEGFRNQVPHKETSEGNPVAAKIADGEYVFPAGFVTAIGKGDNKKGAEILDGLREKLRMHKRSAPKDKIPPKAKSPLDYIKKV